MADNSDLEVRMKGYEHAQKWLEEDHREAEENPYWQECVDKYCACGRCTVHDFFNGSDCHSCFANNYYGLTSYE